jgi:L-asparaginase II
MSFTVDVYRGDLVESRHRVACCVVRADGRLVASSGDPGLVTYWRSAAKPFQALPLVADGGADELGLSDDEIVLTCASHNGEPAHVELARRLLARTGAGEDDLVCGPHPSLSDVVAKDMARRGEKPTRIHSNCSGKHGGMITLGRWMGWGSGGYEQPDHPVQRRCLAEVAAWSGLHVNGVAHGTDGCGVPSFALPLRSMALAYARLGAAGVGDPVEGVEERSRAAAQRIVAALLARPFLLAGTARLDTQLLEATGGRVFAKVGAEGVYSATVPELGLGLALKVEDGAPRALNAALLALLDAVAPGLVPDLDARHHPSVRNTRGDLVGEVVVRVELERSA